MYYDPPETCPCCGAANWDEASERWLHRSEAFCSDACEGDYVAAQRAADNAYAESVLEDARLAREWRM
jgi:hypothetical protein